MLFDRNPKSTVELQLAHYRGSIRLGFANTKRKIKKREKERKKEVDIVDVFQNQNGLIAYTPSPPIPSIVEMNSQRKFTSSSLNSNTVFCLDH